MCEDCGVSPDELPFSEPVRHAVDLLTKKAAEGKNAAGNGAAGEAAYYAAIAADPVASMAKVIDRCNNVSTMAQAFGADRYAIRQRITC